MLDQIEVHNFQSLRNLKLDLGAFTVIVGASSAGKSALVRAIRAVASNVSGTSSISRGCDTAAVTVRSGDTVVTLEHSRGAWRYRLVVDGVDKEFTKLNRGVPEAVTAALRISPVPTGGTSLHFAGQFDRPYLLTDSGAAVARELGELTNVDTIFSAVRDANRRRNTHAGTLRTRTADRDRLIEQAGRFAGLAERVAACDRAEAALTRAAAQQARIDRLTGLTDELAIAQAAQDRAVAVDVPSDATLLHAQTRLRRLRQVLGELATAQAEQAQATTAVDTATRIEEVLRDELHALLLRAGLCPTCNRPTA